MAELKIIESDDLSRKVINSLSLDSKSPRIINIVGQPAAGKSTILNEVSRRIKAGGLSKTPILISPPKRALDSGHIALLQIGVALKTANLMNGDFERLVDGKTGWSDKLEIIGSSLKTNCKKTVLLCDEPEVWTTGNKNDTHFSDRTREVITMLFSLGVDKVVAGRAPPGQMATEKLNVQSNFNLSALFADADYWGDLSSAAENVNSVVSELSIEKRPNPLEARLLVAAFYLGAREQCEVRLSNGDFSRAQIFEVLKSQLSGASQTALHRLLGRVALVRKNFSESLLSELGTGNAAKEVGLIFRKCFLFERDGCLELHDTYRREASANDYWMSATQLAHAHKQLAEYYKKSFEGQLGTAQGEAAILDEMEAYHHAVASDDEAFLDKLTPHFVDQLNIWGKHLSFEKRAYTKAVNVFERALAWDSNDDYATHYAGFNVDLVLKDPKRAEELYKKSTELNPRNPRWHAHYINFLLARGRVVDAKKAWELAVDFNVSTKDDVESWVLDNLHVPTALAAIGVGELDFAKSVIAQVPSKNLELSTQNSVNSIRLHLEKLIEVRRKGAFVPGQYLGTEWPAAGPFRVELALNSGGKLERWLAGQVLSKTKKAFIAKVAIVNFNKKMIEKFGEVQFTAAQIKKWNKDLVIESIEPGRFLEVGIYSDKQHRLALHQESDWIDPLVSTTFPYLDRYLK